MRTWPFPRWTIEAQCNSALFVASRRDADLAEARDEMGQLPGRQRPADQISLHLRATGATHDLQLLGCLDPFGCGFYSEGGAEARDCPDDRASLAADRGNEGTVDLDLVEGEAAQIAQRRIPGAEIVHGDADAERAELVQHAEYRLVVLQQRGLGDLELQSPRGKSRAGERVGD